MEVPKRRALSSQAQTASSSFTTSSRTVSVSNRKFLEEKENIKRRHRIDNRKALNERQNLSEYAYEEDYFDSGSYRADKIGKPWRSPNLSRRGIHSCYEGSVKSGSETHVVNYSTSWQTSSGFDRADQSSCQQHLNAIEHQEASKIEKNQSQMNTETINNSNSALERRVTTSGSTDESGSRYNFFNSLFANSNNNAAQKYGARRILFWKVGGSSGSDVTRGQRRVSMFGFDNAQNSVSDRVTTRSQTRKMNDKSGRRSVISENTDTVQRSRFSRFISWILWPFVLCATCVHHVSRRSKELSGAPYLILVPVYTSLSILRFLFLQAPCCFCDAIRLSCYYLTCTLCKSNSTDAASAKTEKSSKDIAHGARPRRTCCSCPLLCLFFLLLFLLPLFICFSQTADDPQVRIIEFYHSVKNWTFERVDDLFIFGSSAATSVKNVYLIFAATNESDSWEEAEVAKNLKDNVHDKELSESLMKVIREHGARLQAQEKELKAQKIILEGLVASRKTSDQTASDLAVEMKKWEGNLASVHEQISSLDVALEELKRMKQASDSTRSGVDSEEFIALSQKVKEISSEQEKQKTLLDQLNDLRVLVAKLEDLVKDQKDWTMIELKKHEDSLQSFQKLLESSSIENAPSSETLKSLSEKIVAQHERLAAFENQQQGLQALLADLESRMKAEKVVIETKDKKTDNSMVDFAFKLQSLESEQKTLNQRLDIQIKQQTGIKSSKADVDSMHTTGTGSGSCKDCADIQLLIDRALALFAADRIGRPDFALESAGGSIIGTRCTQTYTDRPAVFSLFGVPLFRMSRSPRTVIQPALHPGECWAFRAGKGQVVVRLASDIEVSAISLEHIPKSLSPNGRIDSAPRLFSVKGLASEEDYVGVELGQFEYLDNGQPLQTFDIVPPHKVFRYIELLVLSNHGHAEYTCVYRLRVHGKLVTDTESESEVR